MFEGEFGAGGNPEPQQKLTLEQQLEALDTKTPSPEGEQPADAQSAAATGSEAEASQPSDPISKLDEIEEPKEPEQPQLSEEQQQVLRAVPDRKTAEALYQTAQNYQNFTSAFESGKFDDVEQMFKDWRPEVFESFLEHIYAKRVASGEWVDRFIAESENPMHSTIRQLQQQITGLKSQLQERGQAEQTASQQAAERQLARSYVDHVEGLFNKIDFSPADRRWVWADINAKVSGDPQTQAAVRSGNLNAIVPIFKQAVRDYVNRDKPVQDAKAKTLAQQAIKKPPLQSGNLEPQSALPSDINLVPAEKRDEWMDQELRRLKESTR